MPQCDNMELSPASVDPDNVPEPTLLIIADISGYTRYMTANAKTLAHSQTIITELVMAIVKEVELPLELAKLEGDAVFLYCRKTKGTVPWPRTKELIGAKLLAFFGLFTSKVAELRRSSTCSCSACQNIERLRLKVIVHSGDVLFHQVFHLQELAGVDVIVVHRLLKNSVCADQYLLLTESALADVQFPEAIPLTMGQETIPDIGTIATAAYFPDGAGQAPPPGTFKVRLANSWKLYCKLWFAGLRCGTRARIQAPSDASRVGKALFALFTLLLTPLFLPVGALFVLIHACRRPRA